MRKVLSLITILLVGFVLVACGRDTYTVTFESNGGTAVTALTDVAKDATITAPTAPTRAGFVFVGWFKESTLVNQWNFATDKVTANITLYAKWDAAGPTDQQAVDTTFDWLSIGDLSALTNQSPRLILPTVYQAQGVNISWVIDKLAFIAANGVITQPTHEEGTQTVTLTATLTKGLVTRTKVFTATVLALPPISETIPLINETFNYANGDILTQATIWGPVSGKTGSSLFTVVDTAPQAIPDGSKALKIEAFTELQIEAPIAHTYDLVVIEVDVMQTTSSNGSPINIQSSSSAPVVAFGVDGAALYYRTDNGTLMKTNIEINKWYRMRAEVNLVNKTLEVFYYADNGQLVSMTPGPVTYQGTTNMQALFIRSGSSTTTALRPAAYMTNLVANRIEALPRPVEVVSLGEVTGIRPSVTVEVGGSFTVDTPVIRNLYGNQRILVKDTDYTLVVQNPVDLNTAGTYTVTYTFTNSTNTSNTKVVTQEVVVYSVGEPNEITASTSSLVGYLDGTTDVTITSIQPSGILYYLLSSNEVETAEAIILGDSIEITSGITSIDDILVGNATHIHFVIVLNGNSNVVSRAITRENVTYISTAQEFVTLTTPDGSGVINTSFALTADLDFTGIVFPEHNASFRGVFYGNGYTLSNITINRTGSNYGGIFPRLNGATVRDLIIDNASVTAVDRAGILVGRVENNDSTVMNILIMNSSVSSQNANGVGGVIGLVSRYTALKNVAIIDTTVTALGQKNVGGVVGRVDGGRLNAEDIYVNNVTVTTSVVAGDIAAGMFVGYVRDSVTSIADVNRIVIVNSKIDAIMGGALIGYNRAPGTASAQNAYVDVSFIYNEPTHAGLVGRVNDVASYLDQTTIFGKLTGAVQNAQTQDLANTHTPENQAWWSTNLPAFVSNPLWVFDDNATFALVIYKESSKPMFDVTLDYNVDIPNEVIQVREGNVFGYGAPIVEGYNFVGWYMDAAMTVVIPEALEITEPITLYGKYEALPTYTVSFESNGGSAVADITGIFENAFITAPANPTKDGYTFEGWFKEAGFVNAWNFATDTVTGNTTLYAKWEEIPAVTFTVTFESNGGNAIDPVVIGEGLVITAPATPVKDGFVFVGWFKEVELTNLWDFDVDTVTANITLYAKWDEILPTEIQTAQEFYDMTISGSDGIFLLMNDIDFTGFTWAPMATTPPAFKGTLEGNGFIISNINIQIPSPVTDQFGGIFSRVDGAVIRDLFIYNVTVNTTQRAGTLVGRVMGAGVLIENIVVKNATVQSGDANGTGGLVALISANSEIYNVAVVDSTINSGTLKNAAGLVGRVDGGILYADDIFIHNVTVTSNNTADSDVGVGAIVGYVRNSETSKFSGVRLVATNVTLVGKSAGALAGYVYFPGTIDVMDAYFNVTFSGGIRTGLVGYWRAQTETLDQSSVFVTMTGNVTHSQTLQPTNIVSAPSDLAWWNTNLSAFVLSDLWTVKADGSIELALLTPQGEEPVDPVTFTVTFNSNGGSAVAEAIVEEGGLVTAPAVPTKDGYTFEGWFKEAELTNLWVFASDVVTADMTLYAKWDEVVIDPTPVGTAITTVQEFYNMATGHAEWPLSGTYYLANDLNFTGFTWTWVNGTVFTGILDGNNKTISNLTIVSSQDRAGIFYGFRGTMKNINFDTVSISSSVNARAGLIAGEVTTVAVVLENISIKGLTLSGNNSNGVGGLIGYLNNAATVSNISMTNSSITNGTTATGGLFGRVGDSNAAFNISIHDVYMNQVTVQGTNRVGSILGESNGSSGYIVVTSARVVLSNMTISASSGNAAGFSGRHQSNPSGLGVLNDIYFQGTITGTSVNHVTTDRKYQSITNFWFFGTLTGTLNTNGEGTSNILTEVQNNAWWDTNFASLEASSLWVFNETLNVYRLNNAQ
jgi:uncharacterized repeat protein (TIGR02543 family)